jgi:hypothetical protein
MQSGTQHAIPQSEIKIFIAAQATKRLQPLSIKSETVKKLKQLIPTTMKIVIVILALMTGMGASIKKSAEEMEQAQKRLELNEYRHYPNLLPEVEIVAPAMK